MEWMLMFIGFVIVIVVNYKMAIDQSNKRNPNRNVKFREDEDK